MPHLHDRDRLQLKRNRKRIQANNRECGILKELGTAATMSDVAAAVLCVCFVRLLFVKPAQKQAGGA